jgi:gamma-glutamyltranspeptidase/glutathione hydrolase
VTTVEGPAAWAGAEILRAGGNAADAAVAAAFAQGVVNPMLCGIGGGFHGVFWDAGRKEAVVIGAGGCAPRHASPGMWAGTGQDGAVWSVQGDRNSLGYEASMVPGFVRGAAEAVQRFGSQRVSWKEIMAPAIRLAGEGFQVYPFLYWLWMPATARMQGFIGSSAGPSILGTTDAGRRIYLHPDGSVYRIGEILVQEDYAKTLSLIADQGPQEFYEGSIARKMADDFSAHGGLIDEVDLKTYQARITEPIRGQFQDYEILTEGAPSVGPVTMQLLNILEGWDLREFGWNTPLYLDKLARAMHVTFRDRLGQLGDPDFVEVALDRLLSKDYAAKLRDTIDNGSDLNQAPAGLRELHSETTHVTVVDGESNGAAITHSIGHSSGVVTPGLGFLHNSHMEMFDPTPGSRNEIRPQKRPITGGGPVLFLRHGELFLMIGSPAGARKVSAIVQAFLDVTQFDMTIGEAVAADRIHAENIPRTIIVEPSFPPEVSLGLAARGQRVELEFYSGRLAGVLRSADGTLSGGSDPRGDRGLAVVA